jgi:glycosyltransferase involved in cell wall biosynthesis
MRFLLVSTHVDQTTGYSKVASNLLKQLATLIPKVKVFHFGFQRHPLTPNSRKVPTGIIPYDAAANEDPKEEGFGFNKIQEYIDTVNPDVVMIYNDPLIIARFLEAMKHDRASCPYKLWIYVDQVYEGIAPPLMDAIRQHADKVYVFTEHWKEKLLEYGEFPNVGILEHAVDPNTFPKLPPDARIGVRKSLGIPQDAIVFLNANRNSQRKRLDLTITGFVKLIVDNPTIPYYLIVATNATPQSGAYYDISRIFMRELRKHNAPNQLLVRLAIVDTSPPNVVTDEGINQLYHASDIGLNTSDGEGFGLCQLEHMYTGAPQVVGDTGSFRSFLDEKVARFIPVKDDVYFAGTMPLGGWASTFAVADVAAAMKSAADNLPELRENVRLYPFKTWSQVCDGWLEDVLSV